jgi:hypothetical protein
MWFKYAITHSEFYSYKNPPNFVSDRARKIFNQLKARDRRIVVQHTIPPQALCSIFYPIMPDCIKSKFKQNTFIKDNEQNLLSTEEIKDIILNEQNQINELFSNNQIISLLSPNLTKSIEYRKQALHQCFFSTDISIKKDYIKSPIQLIFSIPIIFFAEAQILLFGNQFHHWLKEKYNYFNEGYDFLDYDEVRKVNLNDDIEKIENFIYYNLISDGQLEITTIHLINMKYLFGIAINGEFIYLNPYCTKVNYEDIFYKSYVREEFIGDYEADKERIDILIPSFSINQEVQVPISELNQFKNLSNDKERKYFSKISPRVAYEYAFKIDKKPHPVTIKAVCKEPEFAYYYARDVELPLGELCQEIRESVCKDPEFAYYYAIDVELKLNQLSQEIKMAVCKNPIFSANYAREVELPLRKLSREIREAACRNLNSASYYLKHVEKPLGQFSEEIKNAICKDERGTERYNAIIKGLPIPIIKPVIRI